MSVFVVNCGSSSLKWSVVDVDSGATLGSGTVQKVVDHATALGEVLEVAPVDAVSVVAHRVVHGGERFSAPVLVNDAVVAAIRDLSVLAPLHNPANAIAIGPVLQGLNKPVNDLSRGATVHDIVNTVAITAIQAGSA